jgi:hypothetical protein
MFSLLIPVYFPKNLVFELFFRLLFNTELNESLNCLFLLAKLAISCIDDPLSTNLANSSVAFVLFSSFKASLAASFEVSLALIS